MNPYNLRHNAKILQSLVNSVLCGTESISYVSPKVLDVVSDPYENLNSLHNFKMVIKKWKPENCPCRICKVFFKNMEFC